MQMKSGLLQMTAIVGIVMLTVNATEIEIEIIETEIETETETETGKETIEMTDTEITIVDARILPMLAIRFTLLVSRLGLEKVTLGANFLSMVMWKRFTL
jgi:hypothetical protein